MTIRWSNPDAGPVHVLFGIFTSFTTCTEGTKRHQQSPTYRRRIYELALQLQRYLSVEFLLALKSGAVGAFEEPGNEGFICPVTAIFLEVLKVSC